MFLHGPLSLRIERLLAGGPDRMPMVSRVNVGLGVKNACLAMSASRCFPPDSDRIADIPRRPLRSGLSVFRFGTIFTGVLSPKKGRSMCKRCEEIDKRIEQFRQLLRLALLPAEREHIDRRIKQLGDERARLHENQQ
jgi:hypothetical protein